LGNNTGYTVPLSEVELSCRGVPAAAGGGQYVFFGTGTHEVRSPSVRCDSSRMNLPSTWKKKHACSFNSLYLQLEILHCNFWKRVESKDTNTKVFLVLN